MSDTPYFPPPASIKDRVKIAKAQNKEIQKLERRNEKLKRQRDEARDVAAEKALAAAPPQTPPAAPPPPPPPAPPAPSTYAERRGALAAKAADPTQLAAMSIFDSLDNEGADLVAAQARR